MKKINKKGKGEKKNITHMKFSDKFNITPILEDQGFEFVDIELDKDKKLFIDPVLIYKYRKSWYSLISDCYGHLTEYISSSKKDKARKIICELNEFKYTHLGYSNFDRYGKGLGEIYTNKMYKTFSSLKSSLDIEEMKEFQNITLIIKGVAEDRISDMTSNIISIGLIDFTEDICRRYKIPLEESNIKIWDIKKHSSWKMHKCNLPHYKNKPIILVPKEIVSKRLSVSKKQFWNNIIIPIEQKKAFDKEDDRITTLGRFKRKKIITKKEMAKRFPSDADSIINYIKANPKTLKKIKPRIINKIKKVDDTECG